LPLLAHEFALDRGRTPGNCPEIAQRIDGRTGSNLG